MGRAERAEPEWAEPEWAEPSRLKPSVLKPKGLSRVRFAECADPSGSRRVDQPMIRGERRSVGILASGIRGWLRGGL